MPELRHFLRSKIHRARVTRVELDYIGSCAIDEDLLDTAGILPYEQVHVWNVNNGERFVTYAIAAPRGTGTVSVNGSAARRAQINDVVIIATFCLISDPTLNANQPTVVFVDENNRSVSSAT